MRSVLIWGCFAIVLPLVSNAVELNLGELLVGDDSGPLGSGAPLSLSTEDGVVYEFHGVLPAISLGAGQHALHVRVRDALGRVSPRFSLGMFLDQGSYELRTLASAEFWAGPTPLPGAGQALALSFLDGLGIVVETSATPLARDISAGSFGARVLDTQLQASPATTQAWRRPESVSAGMPEITSAHAVFVGADGAAYPLSLVGDASPRLLAIASGSVRLADLPPNQVFWVMGRFTDNANGSIERPASGLNWRDSDGDGLADLQELQIGTNPDNPDSDGDGLSDSEELALGTDPTRADTDGDELDDGNEVALGTDPTNPDTDGDGVPDGEEIAAGTDPLNPSSFPVLFRNGFEQD